MRCVKWAADLRHLTPPDLARRATVDPTGELRSEIMIRADSPTGITGQTVKHVWTVQAIVDIASAFPSDPEIIKLINRKLTEADSRWLRSAHTESLTALLKRLPISKPILKELASRRYSMSSEDLQSIISSKP